ncbi:hypothetical protein OXX79_000084 [Metschnikowia pulcherrima]
MMTPIFILALMAALSLAFPVTIDCIGDDDEVFEETMTKVCEMATNGSDSLLASEAYLYETNEQPPSKENQEIVRLLSNVHDHLSSFVNDTDFIGENFDAGSDAFKIDIKKLDDALGATDEEHWPAGVIEDRQSLQELLGFMENTARALRDLRDFHTPGLQLMKKAVHIDITTWIVRSAAKVFAGKTTQVASLWFRMKSLILEIRSTPGVSGPFKRLLKAEFRFAARTLNAFGGLNTRGRRGRKGPNRRIRPKTHR